MGKQINYYMDYHSFLTVAQKALDEGCMIIRRGSFEQPPLPSGDISAIAEEHLRYLFYLPELAEPQYDTDKNGMHYAKSFCGPFSLALIEASFSRRNDKGNINRARLYIPTGYYDEKGEWIARSEQLTKTYEKLARAARKAAPSTDIDYEYVGFADGETHREKRRVYISPLCLEWLKQGYKL